MESFNRLVDCNLINHKMRMKRELFFKIILVTGRMCSKIIIRFELIAV